MKEKMYIVIPAYNESETIKSVIEEWYPLTEKYGEGSRMAIVNDGSKDNTLEIALKLAEKYPRLTVLDKPNGGHGSAVIYGYKYALDKGADYVFQTDSDGQTRPEEFEQFWINREKYDMVIGERSGRQDGFSRVFVTKTLRLVLRVIFGVWVKDANTPYRLMKADSLRSCLDLFDDDYNLPNVIISVAMKKSNKPVLFRHITFRPRQGGKNSINMKKIIKIGMQALKDFKAINKKLK